MAWKRASLAALWESPTAHRPPPGPVRGHLWPWEAVRPLALEAAEIRSPDVVERRVLQLVNPYPASPTDESTVANIVAAIQILLPGESARPHRHSMNALRFVLEGDGAVTVVNGKRCPMHLKDLVLTPGGCWHEHHHPGDRPILWLDVLDVPLQAYLGNTSFQPGPVAGHAEMLPESAFSRPNLLPETVDSHPDYSPVFSYPYADVAAVMAGVPRGRDGSRTVRYVNPLTGGAPMSTLDCRVTRLDAGETRPRRSNSNTIFVVIEGEGETQIGADCIGWRQNDIFTFPRNNWMNHRAGRDGASLLAISDREVLRRIGILEERFDEAP